MQIASVATVRRGLSWTKPKRYYTDNGQVFLSYNFLMPGGIVDKEDNSKQHEERLSHFLRFSMKDMF